jgi:hypothetical protein
MLTRTIGVVSGAAILTLGFQAIETAALGSGADRTQAFLAALQVMFRIAGIAAALTAAMVAWPARR